VVRLTELCVISPAGTHETCFALGDYDVGSVGGWTDATSVVAWVRSAAGAAAVVLVNVDSRRITILKPDANAPLVSADGKWVAASLADPAEPAGATVVFPVERPDQAVVVRRGGETAEFAVLWGRTSAPRRYLSRLTAVAPRNPIPISATYRLHAIGLAPAGNTVPTRNLTWWSADPSIASVTDSGEVVPHRTGVVTMLVTAGGWRSDSVRITVGQPRVARVLHEVWGDSIERQWRPYGRPRPSLTTGPGGVPSFFNNGDGSFESGAHSRRVFDAASGFGIEATLSSPVTRNQWQLLAVELRAERDSTALAMWDHLTDGPSSEVAGGPGLFCAVAVPWGEGPRWARTIGVSVSGESAPLRTPPNLVTGRWYRVRLQLFADGRCGFALDGRPIWISNSTLPVNLPIRIHLRGNSSGTTMLVGPFEAWEGVRGDVDWRRAGARF
jgi:hypothetical protein